MLSKMTYELLPMTYLVAGVGSISMLETSYGIIAGTILYSVGALVWVMRSNYRRTDQRRQPRRSLFLLPEWLYEFIPFLLIACAAFIIQLSHQFAATIAATLLTLYAMHKLYLRYQHRRHEWQELSIYAPSKRTASRNANLHK
ncbi:hypothetical protein [Motilimonas sp. KMU-193]|uniref:hypothetical protein n=1 Tax=Motilimonas sp. KMU-193 TaxID=3388668 RepID=UPI00396AFBAE